MVDFSKHLKKVGVMNEGLLAYILRELKTDRIGDESDYALGVRVIQLIGDLPEEGWQALGEGARGEEAQDWFNKAVPIMNSRKVFLHPDTGELIEKVDSVGKPKKSTKASGEELPLASVVSSDSQSTEEDDSPSPINAKKPKIEKAKKERKVKKEKKPNAKSGSNKPLNKTSVSYNLRKYFFTHDDVSFEHAQQVLEVPFSRSTYQILKYETGVVREILMDCGFMDRK